MKSQNFRFYTQGKVKLGIKANYIFNELKTVFSTEATSFKIIYRWINAFNKQSNRIEDLHKVRKPITKLTKANIDTVRQVIDNDPWSSYRRSSIL